VAYKNHRVFIANLRPSFGQVTLVRFVRPCCSLPGGNHSQATSTHAGRENSRRRRADMAQAHLTGGD